MNYQKIYDALVEKAKPRGLDKSKYEDYFEIHHIVPRSLGGSNKKDNLVMFTAREHFVAHMLLWRANPNDISLMRAAHMMSTRWVSGMRGGSQKAIHSKTYAKLRQEYAEAVSVQCSGEGNPFFGKVHSEKTREKMKAARLKSLANQALNGTKTVRVSRKRSVFKSDHKIKSVPKYVPDYIPTLNRKMSTDDDRFLWASAQAIKDFWAMSGNPGGKLLSSMVCAVSGYEVSQPKMKTLVARFEGGWEPCSDSSWLVHVLTCGYDESKFITLKDSLSITLEELSSKIYKEWLLDRHKKRSEIEAALEEFDVELHKNVSVNKVDMVDVAEALLLWKTGYVQQNVISELFGVKRNTMSNILENDLRWASVKSVIDRIQQRLIEKSLYTPYLPPLAQKGDEFG